MVPRGAWEVSRGSIIDLEKVWMFFEKFSRKMIEYYAESDCEELDELLEELANDPVYTYHKYARN